ncbi:hypothetical protein Btru_070540 [Bulinus truncatus]|nr:hypothetical protein Btru_070540 [Bulinus truncatus]
MKLYLVCGVLLCNIALECALYMSETYPPVHLAEPLVLLKPGTCDLTDERNFDLIMLEGLVTLGKFPFLDQDLGYLNIHMKLTAFLELVLDMKFEASLSNPFSLRSAKYGMQQWTEFLKPNNLIRIGAQMQIRQDHLDATFVLSYMGKNSTKISSESKKVDFPVYGNNIDKCKGSVPIKSRSTNGSDRLHACNCRLCGVYLTVGWLISLVLLTR